MEELLQTVQDLDERGRHGRSWRRCVRRREVEVVVRDRERRRKKKREKPQKRERELKGWRGMINRRLDRSRDRIGGEFVQSGDMGTTEIIFAGRSIRESTERGGVFRRGEL
jgi:hypothetical protein